MSGDFQATTAELAEFRVITEPGLHRVRKADGKVSVYDVIRAVTGKSAVACRVTWHRLTETHPELVTNWY